MSSQSPDRSANIGAAEILRSPLVVSLAALSVVCLPVLYSYLTNLWTREYYQFFPFAFASVFWFAATRARREPEFDLPTWRKAIHIVAAVGCAALAGLGALQGSPWPAYCAYIVAVGLLLDHWQEEGTGRRLFYSLLPLLLTVRPPLDGDNVAIQKLQLLTSKIASNFLNALEIDHILSGNIIQPMKGPALLVAEACSGVQSLFTVMFIAAFIGASKQYSVVRSLLLISTGVFWALLMNVCRVLAIAIGQVRFNLDLTVGWRHDAVGYAAMLLAIPFLLSTDRFVQFLFGGIPDDPRKYNRINVMVLAWNWLFTAPVADEDGSRGTVKSRWAVLGQPQRAIVILTVLLCGVPFLATWAAPGFWRGVRGAAPTAEPATEPPAAGEVTQ